jgi:hypothetical protein
MKLGNRHPSPFGREAESLPERLEVRTSIAADLHPKRKDGFGPIRLVFLMK